MSTEYETELAAWKAKHGLTKQHDTSNSDEMAMLAEDQASNKKCWCAQCDKHMLVREMRLITRSIDPYRQCDEGETDYIAKSNRVRMCPECFAEEYPDDAPKDFHIPIPEPPDAP